MEIDSHFLPSRAEKKLFIKTSSPFSFPNIFTCFQIIISNYLCLFYIFCLFIFCCHHLLCLLKAVFAAKKTKRSSICSTIESKTVRIAIPFIHVSRISDECFPPIFGVKLNSRLLFCGTIDRLDCAKKYFNKQ